MPRPTGPFDGGRLHIMAEQCPTCIFRPGNLMSLNQGAVEAMLARCQQRDTVIHCHETLDGKRAVCNGLWNRRQQGPGVPCLQLAERLGIAALDGTPNGLIAASLHGEP